MLPFQTRWLQIHAAASSVCLGVIAAVVASDVKVPIALEIWLRMSSLESTLMIAGFVRDKKGQRENLHLGRYTHMSEIAENPQSTQTPVKSQPRWR